MYLFFVNAFTAEGFESGLTVFMYIYIYILFCFTVKLTAEVALNKLFFGQTSN